jgi:hypothetical protein
MIEWIWLIVFCIWLTYLMYIDSKYDTPIHKEMEEMINNIWFENYNNK